MLQMGVMSQVRGSFVLSLLLIAVVAPAGLCFAAADGETTSFHVAGFGECADCQKNNYRTSDAFPGLLVSIDCKVANEGDEMERVASGELDENGSFAVALPTQAVDETGKKLKQDCFAQLHSAAAAPCPMHQGIDAAKLELKSAEDGKLVFGPAKNLKFSTALCTSKLLWPVFNYPPLPILPWKKSAFPEKPFLKLGHPLWFHHPFFKHKHLPKHPVVNEHPPVAVVKKHPPVVVKRPPVVAKKPPVVVKKHHKAEVIPPVPVKKPFPFFKHPFHKEHPWFKKPFPWFKKPLPLFHKPKPFPPLIPHA